MYIKFESVFFDAKLAGSRPHHRGKDRGSLVWRGFDEEAPQWWRALRKPLNRDKEGDHPTIAAKTVVAESGGPQWWRTLRKPLTRDKEGDHPTIAAKTVVAESGRPQWWRTLRKPLTRDKEGEDPTIAARTVVAESGRPQWWRILSKSLILWVAMSCDYEWDLECTWMFGCASVCAVPCFLLGYHQCLSKA